MKTIRTNDTGTVRKLVKQLWLPAAGSHKGNNGRVLVIGGSELFHSSLVWAATIASKIADMVHVASPAEINERLVRERIKEKFLDGIVIPWAKVEEYIMEDDVVLIGPGMPRKEGLEAGETPTDEIVNRLLTIYQDKKWVIDGGALQEVKLELLNKNMIITPHAREYERLEPVLPVKATVLKKGPTDLVMQKEKTVGIEGGNAGLTKGGTGDVLAGLTAALYAKNDAWTAAQTASILSKRAGDELQEKMGTYFNATDLVQQIPQTLQKLLG